jgi:membrane fusion protein, multidrug efflux system
MKMFLLKWAWMAFLSTFLLVSLWLVFSKGQGEAPRPQKELIDAEISPVQSEEIPIMREVTGTISSLNDATLASRVAGLVEEIRVREGSRVKAGEILIVLDDRDLRAQRDRAEAELENATLQLQRVRTLYAERSAAKQELDNAERIHKVSEATLRTIEANLAYTRITAPFDGIITTKMIEVGELASPGRSLLRIEDPKNFRLEATVAETDVSHLRVGQSVTVRLDATGGGEITGRVAQILPVADPSTHSFLVKVNLPRVRSMRSGLFGRMMFPVGTRNGLMVPQSSVSVKGEMAQVYIVGESGLIQLRLIQLGRVYRNRVDVLSGLTSGERVLTRFAEGQEGKIVRIPGGPPS